MNTSKLFFDFDTKIRLSDSKIAKLKSNREALRDKIRAHFKKENRELPRFYSQGSFALNTNLNPIKKETSDGDVKEEYDLDDGIYFASIESERKDPAIYHQLIQEAVNGHADKVITKTTCVRVIYKDGHHIDLPCYWLEKDGNVPQLAHKTKGYIESDPKAFKEWVDYKISIADSNGQLRRVIRYFKAWKDFIEEQNIGFELPSGFILTILICLNFSKSDRDDLSFKNTAESIKKALNKSFTCYRPTVPTDEELLADYSKDVVLKEIETLVCNIQKAKDSNCEKEASEYLRKVFGSRFPLGIMKGEEPLSSGGTPIIRTKVSPLWLS